MVHELTFTRSICIPLPLSFAPQYRPMGPFCVGRAVRPIPWLDYPVLIPVPPPHHELTIHRLLQSNSSSVANADKSFLSQLTSQPFDRFVRHTLYRPRRCLVDCEYTLANEPRLTVVDNWDGEDVSNRILRERHGMP